MASPTVSSSEQRRNPPRNTQALMDQDRAHREAELAAQYAAHQPSPVYPATSVEAGVTSRSTGVPCLVPALRNEHLPKDFKGPRKVPNYAADLPPEAWVESYEMSMELLDVSDATCAKYFTMILDGTTRTWLKGRLPTPLGHGPS